MAGWDYARLIAHRCGGAAAPENTLAGLEVAASAGYGMVEFDVMLAACGTPVLIHDETLERTTDGRGRVCALHYDELAALDAGGWHSARFRGERIPRLNDALEMAARLGLAVNVEIKPAAGFEAVTGAVVAELVRDHWRGEEPALLSSFSRLALAEARRVAPELRRGVLFEALPDDWREQSEAEAAWSVHCDGSRVSPAQIAAVVAAGFPLVCYTVNEPAAARQLFDAGVSGIFTDTLAPGAFA